MIYKLSIQLKATLVFLIILTVANCAKHPSNNHKASHSSHPAPDDCVEQYQINGVVMFNKRHSPSPYSVIDSLTPVQVTKIAENKLSPDESTYLELKHQNCKQKQARIHWFTSHKKEYIREFSIPKSPVPNVIKLPLPTLFFSRVKDLPIKYWLAIDQWKSSVSTHRFVTNKTTTPNWLSVVKFNDKLLEQSTSFYNLSILDVRIEKLAKGFGYIRLTALSEVTSAPQCQSTVSGDRFYQLPPFTLTNSSAPTSHPRTFSMPLNIKTLGTQIILASSNTNFSIRCFHDEVQVLELNFRVQLLRDAKSTLSSRE